MSDGGSGDKHPKHAYTRVPNAAAVDANTSREIDLFVEGELGDKRARLGDRAAPAGVTGDIFCRENLDGVREVESGGRTDVQSEKSTPQSQAGQHREYG